MHTLDFESSNEVTFNVVVLAPGEQGPAGVPLDTQAIQFYDTRHVDGFTALGQHVVTYDLNTVMPGYTGLILHGGVPDWMIDADTMNLIRAWASEWWIK